MDLCKGVEKDFRKDNDNEVMKSEGEYILGRYTVSVLKILMSIRWNSLVNELKQQFCG